MTFIILNLLMYVIVTCIALLIYIPSMNWVQQVKFQHWWDQTAAQLRNLI